jgi:hypothetical protein
MSFVYVSEREVCFFYAYILRVIVVALRMFVCVYIVISFLFKKKYGRNVHVRLHVYIPRVIFQRDGEPPCYCFTNDA